MKTEIAGRYLPSHGAFIVPEGSSWILIRHTFRDQIAHIRYGYTRLVLNRNTSDMQSSKREKVGLYTQAA